MLIGHISDLHGDLRKLFASTAHPDVWVFSGDIFPNETRGDRAIEVPYQTEWFKSIMGLLISRLGGAPVLWVEGNHDYVNLATLLREKGYDNAWDITQSPFEIGGHRFVGMAGINWIEGEWNGETHDFREKVDHAFSQDPTILVTHAPPAGILDEVGGYGVKYLTTALTYHPHRIGTHLFGHCHADAGQDREEMGIHFYNGACTVRFIEVQ